MKIQSALRRATVDFERALRETKEAVRKLKAVPRDSYQAGGASSDWRIGQQRLEGAPAPRFPTEKADRIVDALYRGLLGREPDPSGREAYRPMVEAGRLSEVVDAVVHSEELKQRLGSMSPEELSKSLYQGILGRDPDPEGDVGTQAAIGRKHLAHRVLDMLLSPEHAQLLDAPQRPTEPEPTPTPAPTPSPTPGPQRPPEPGPALSTVPWRPEFSTARIDKSSVEAAVKSAAQWVKDVKPEFFQVDDRQTCFEMMTWVIGALRAHGYDAHRVVNHPSKPVGDGWRYGSDALVLNGTVFDVYRGIGDPNASVPQALNVGQYGPGRLRE